jgi:hypothetical protein
MSARRYRRYKDGVIYQSLTLFQEEANIYHTPGGTNCGEITLKADGCFSGCSPPPPPPARCPTNLNGVFEFPHLIIPIGSSNPNKAPGTSYFSEVTSTISRIFNFDIPASDTGKACSLAFLFSTQSHLTTSSVTFSGNGGIDFSLLNGVANSATFYANAPGVKTDYCVTTVVPGNSYSIATFPYPGGTTISFELKASGNISLDYF